MSIKLRQYQIDGIRQIFQAWAPKPNGLDLKNILYQMPTGTGKTTLFSEIVRKAEKKEKKVLLVVHRLELVEQIVARLGHFSIVAGEIIAGKKPDLSKNVQVASIQTLTNREYPNADLIIIDECHHSKANSYKKLWDIYPNARFLGVTATPIRLNGEGFDDQYEKLITAGQIYDFIRDGYLVKPKQLVVSNPDVSHVIKNKGDYNTAMLRGVMLENSLMANLVESYKTYAFGKKMIVFAVDIEHSKSIVERYKNADIIAVHLDANTSKKERFEIMESFRKGEINVLSNVDIVSEGFDVPDCDAVQLARPTKSLALYLQQVGRCLRPAQNKEYALILDNAGLWLEHGLAIVNREWNLQGVKKRKNNFYYDEIIGMDKEGILKEINMPEEAEGLELIELTKELEHLLTFESYLTNAKNRNHKLISAYYQYNDFLEGENREITKIEIDYCKKRLSDSVKPGFWSYQYNRLITKKVLL